VRFGVIFDGNELGRSRTIPPITPLQPTAAAAKAPRAARQPAPQRFDGGLARLDRCKNHPVAPNPGWKGPLSITFYFLIAGPEVADWFAFARTRIIFGTSATHENDMR